MKKKIFNIIWALASAMLFQKFICDDTLGYSNSVMPLITCAVIYIMLQKGTQAGDKRKISCTHVLGFIFACMISMGHSLDVNETAFFAWQPICVVLFTHNIAILLGMIWDVLERINVRLSGSRRNRRIYIIFKHPIFIFCFILLCWMPVFLADFPGGFRYDATVELAQSANGYNGNIPLLHSLIVTKLIPFVYVITGSWNAGVAVYVVIQMILVAAMYTFILKYFYSKGINKDLLLGLVAACGLFPVIQMLVVQEVRDIMFSLLLVNTTFWIYVMATDKDYFFSRIRRPILLAASIVLTVYARNNNMGIVVPLLIIAVVIIVCIVNIKKYQRGVIVFSVTTVMLYIIVGCMLTFLCKPYNEDPSISQSLSVMSQPIVRAYMNNDDWTDEEIEELGKYFDLDKMLYNPENADYTKNNLKLSDNFGEFFGFLCRMGIKYPRDYIDGILATNQNMWFPGSVVDGYNQSGIEGFYHYNELDKCYLYMRDLVEYPAEHKSYLPRLLKYYSNIGLNISFEKIPVVSMLFSIGFWFWGVLNLVFYLMYKKNKKLLWPSVIMLLYMFMSSFVPLVLLRYFAAVFLAAPLLIVFTLQPSCENVQESGTHECELNSDGLCEGVEK